MKKILTLSTTFLFCLTSYLYGQGVDVNGVRDVTLDSLAKANQARPISGSTRHGDNPVLFLVGNSTMRNGTLGNGNNGQWGWGYFAHEYFDESKVTVENHALGGTSPRTFYRKLWPAVLAGIRPGDYVVLELGHNDNGPIDRDRARSSYVPATAGEGPFDTLRAGIPQLANDSILVTIQEDGKTGIQEDGKTGRQEWVYTFGGYVRRFVQEIRDKGASPILLTLTPRNSRVPNPYPGDARRFGQRDSIFDRKLDTFTPWIKQLALELDLPCIDLNDISGHKLDNYDPWKANYHFFGDKIHSSAFGAQMNAASFAEGLARCGHPTVEKLQLALLQDKVFPVSLKTPVVNGIPMVPVQTCLHQARPGKQPPTVFITGDSTVKNEDKDEDGMWGWGSQAYTIFNTKKCRIINAAKAGRSTRTFLAEGRWDAVYHSIEPGDYVLIQFGHNDIGPIDNQKERGVIATADTDTCHVYRMASNGQYQVIYSFGWYLRKFITDVRERGGIPVLVSLTPRNEWPGGKVERRNSTYGQWYRQVAEETDCALLDLHNITADALDKMGREQAAAMFNHDHTHTSLAGAKLNARGIAKGIRQLKKQGRQDIRGLYKLLK